VTPAPSNALRIVDEFECMAAPENVCGNVTAVTYRDRRWTSIVRG
jgi:hypothetical protein